METKTIMVNCALVNWETAKALKEIGFPQTMVAASPFYNVRGDVWYAYEIKVIDFVALGGGMRKEVKAPEMSCAAPTLLLAALWLVIYKDVRFEHIPTEEDIVAAVIRLKSEVL